MCLREKKTKKKNTGVLQHHESLLSACILKSKLKTMYGFLHTSEAHAQGSCCQAVHPMNIKPSYRSQLIAQKQLKHSSNSSLSSERKSLYNEG